MVPVLPQLTWEYKGEETNDEEPEGNLQIAAIGDRVLHDVFDMCTILPAGLKDGKLHVKLDEDNSERQLTVGHFKTVIEADLLPAKKSVPSSDADCASVGANGNGDTGAVNPVPQPAEPDGNTGNGAAIKEPGANNEAGDNNGGGQGGGRNGQAGTQGSGDGTQPHQPSNDGGSGDDNNAAENTQLLQAVLAKMETQVDEFGLFEEGADLIFHKRLVMMDVKGIASKDGSSIKVGKAVRDRGC
eukprot:6173276-Pleurochrysis_carterae.AAC.1